METIVDIKFPKCLEFFKKVEGHKIRDKQWPEGMFVIPVKYEEFGPAFAACPIFHGVDEKGKHGRYNVGQGFGNMRQGVNPIDPNKGWVIIN